MTEPTPAPTRGTIHDLGYKRYAGERRPQATRHQVIARHVIVMAWRGWWRLKLWVVFAGMAAAAAAAIMYAMLFIAQNPVVQQFGVQGIRWADYLLPLSVNALSPFGLVVSFTVVVPLIANDMRAGSFEFYFARPLRPIDYTLGKALGAALAVGSILLLGPTFVALSRVAMCGDPAEVVAAIPLVPKAMLAGAAATFAYAAIPLGFSALSTRPGYTLGAWAGYYFLFGSLAQAVASQTGIPALGALQIGAAVESIAYAVFDVSAIGSAAPPSAWAAVASLVVQGGAALGFAYARVRRAERAGMGGG